MVGRARAKTMPVKASGKNQHAEDQVPSSLEPRGSSDAGSAALTQKPRSLAMKKAMSGVKATSSAITTVGHMRRNDVVRTTYGLSDADMSALEAKEASFRARVSTEQASGAGDGCCGGWRRLPVINPDSTMRTRWDIAQATALLYVALMVPVRTGFFADPPVLSAGWWLELGVDVYFIADIVVNLRTAYRSHDNELVVSLSKIARHYAHGWLIIDVIACIPITYILYADNLAPACQPARSNNNTPLFCESAGTLTVIFLYSNQMDYL